MYHATLLDGYTIHKDDLNWFELKKLVSLTVYDRSAEDEVIDKAKKADIVLTNKVPITQTTIANLPKLKYIVSLATGTDHIDLAACKHYNIGVSNLNDYATHSVAQLVLSFIFDWLYRLDHYRKDMQKYEWTKCLDFSYEIAPIEELRNQKLGLVGMGKIAQKVGSVASAFDMDIHYHSRTFKKLPFDATYWSELHKMLPMVDYLSLHCPLKPETHQIINDRTISQLKSNCLVINTGRGQLIDENALADALNQGRIKGACVDVLTKEPPTSTNPLLNAANCLVTPHIGWRSKQARQRAITQTYENIEAFLKGDMIRAIVTA